MLYPERHNNHTLEQKSEIFFRQHLPPEWNVTKPNNDYGIDLQIEISEDGQYRGLNLIVQLKASTDPNILGEFERHTLRQANYNYLNDNLLVAMVIKYVEANNEAYYTLLRDIEPPANPAQENFTVKFPLANRITQINWDAIVNYVRGVTDKKLAAIRVQNKNQ